MADISITPANVVIPPDALLTQGFAGETLAMLDVVLRDNDGRWVKATPATATASARIALVASGGVAEDQPVLLLEISDVEITLGSILTDKGVYVLSAANAGKIAPIGDLGGSDLVYLVGIAVSATVIRTLLKYTGA